MKNGFWVSCFRGAFEVWFEPTFVPLRWGSKGAANRGHFGHDFRGEFGTVDRRFSVGPFDEITKLGFVVVTVYVSYLALSDLVAYITR